jgi:molybdopterin-guanine dinucleotide biosynthesis protein A
VRIGVVVLAGGAARRWGGRDKTAAMLEGRTVLEHALEGLRAGVRASEQAAATDAAAGGGEQSVPVIVAGSVDHEARGRLIGDIRWVREDPPGQGPVSGLAAALEVLPADVEVVVVGAGDAPFGGTAVPRLLAALDGGADAAVGVDPAGRRQPLLATYLVGALRRAFAGLGAFEGIPLRRVLGELRLATVPVTAREALDLDTPGLLEEAARQLRGDRAGVPAEGPSS